MSTQKQNGMAFEWAIASALSQVSGFNILDSLYSKSSKFCYESSSQSKKVVYDKAAAKSIEHIFLKENLSNWNPQTTLIKFNSDSAGQTGDVRDVIICGHEKELGISCKTNHEALKHPRLSKNLDFIKKWGISDSGCSEEYWKEISPIFDYLNAIKASSNGNATWEQLDNKAELIYWPILEAWESEIWRAISLSPEKEKEICKNFLTYLIGRKDFYKIMSKDSNRVEIQAFNFYGGLATRQTKFPTNINMINNKDGGIYSKTIIFNHGYSINFRIHSASSKVEASLKFDINAIGLPTSEVYQQTFDLI
jgi:hypothetical protein